MTFYTRFSVEDLKNLTFVQAVSSIKKQKMEIFEKDLHN